jgi:hypothetical protein
MRLTILIMFTPQGLINAYTDYYFYFQSAQLSEQGYFPFVNMWYEYPPMLAYLPLGVYHLTRAIVPVGGVDSFGYQLFARLLGMVFLFFETGVLVLLYKTTLQVWGAQKAEWIGWVYSGLSLPLFFWLYAHQVVVIAFSLLAIFWFITRKSWHSAVALGLATAAKLTPVILLPPVVKFLWPQRRVIAGYVLVVMSIFGIQYLPFMLMDGGAWVAASFRAIAHVGSYGTIWAILDDNWGPGTYGPLPTRIQIEQAAIPHANPSGLPGWAVFIAFALLYALFFFRPVERQNPRHFIWFVTLTTLIFHLYLKGWSPQWAVMVIPLILLSFPNHLGLILALLLTATVFVEWPLNAAFNLRFIAVYTILARSILFVSMLVLLVRRLWPPIGQPVRFGSAKND